MRCDGHVILIMIIGDLNLAIPTWLRNSDTQEQGMLSREDMQQEPRYDNFSCRASDLRLQVEGLGPRPWGLGGSATHRKCSCHVCTCWISHPVPHMGPPRTAPLPQPRSTGPLLLCSFGLWGGRFSPETCLKINRPTNETVYHQSLHKEEKDTTRWQTAQRHGVCMSVGYPCIHCKCVCVYMYVILHIYIHTHLFTDT